MKRMVVVRIILVALAVVMVGAGGVALAHTYAWTDSQANHEWDDCLNWNFIGGGAGCRYPSTTHDDAIIPSTGGPWTVELVTDAIDNLTISDDTDFDSSTGSPVTLTVDTLTIAAQVTVTFTSNAKIVSAS